MFPSDSNFDTDVTLETEAMSVSEELPFHILFLGNWRGREIRNPVSNLKDLRRPIEIDCDNFDNVMKKLRVGLDLDFQGESENILSFEFTNLDDFHPDAILKRLPLFANLRDIRQKLSNADTFGEAACEVRSWVTNDGNIRNAEIDEKTVLPEIDKPVPDNLLDQILSNNNETISAFHSQTVDELGFSSLINELVKPHLIQTDIAEQSKLLMIVDEVISDLMRKILHHSEFRALESAWRGLSFLIKRTEINANLKIYLLDISKDEVTNSLKSVANLTDSSLFQVIKSGAANLTGKQSWAVICGNYNFSLNVGDIATLIRLGTIAKDIKAPFISHIEPEMFGFKGFGEIQNYEGWRVSEASSETKLWMTLRSLPEAIYLGLALPRFLVRLPYGIETEPTESFYFEEFSGSINHENYLWVNPAFACALLLAQTYSEYGWNISQNLCSDIDDLPVHLYRENNETKSKPCAEIVMTQNNCQQILDQGLMPLISFQNSDYIRLGRFQSIADPFSRLEGKWS